MNKQLRSELLFFGMIMFCTAVYMIIIWQLPWNRAFRACEKQGYNAVRISIDVPSNKWVSSCFTVEKDNGDH